MPIFGEMRLMSIAGSEMPEPNIQPPRLRSSPAGGIDNGSLADLVEWFLNYDERTSRIRHPYTEELFQWKLHDDIENGVGIYPFENAEARFAVGIFQALEQNNS